MSIDHIVAYQKMTSSKRYGDPPLPDWVYKERLSYPIHPHHSELIEEYKKTKKQREESAEVLRSAFERQWKDPENSRLVEFVKQCQQHLQQAEQALSSAEQTLREFNNHTPQERIDLYEAEIREWETQLAEAQKAEHEYTEAMLNDPDAARKRLERMVNGYSGEKAEYSTEQLSKLRSLRNNVESIELKILNAQRNIERIYELVAQEECKARVQSAMDLAIPKFSEACARLAVAWEELQSLATEHSIRVVSPHNLQIPVGANFKQSNAPHEAPSSIYIVVGK